MVEEIERFVTGLPLQAFLLWLFFGHDILWAMLLALAAVPVLFAGIYAGLALSRLIPERILRAAATTVLVLIAVSAIALPWLR